MWFRLSGVRERQKGVLSCQESIPVLAEDIGHVFKGLDSLGKLDAVRVRHLGKPNE